MPRTSPESVVALGRTGSVKQSRQILLGWRATPIEGGYIEEDTDQILEISQIVAMRELFTG